MASVLRTCSAVLLALATVAAADKPVVSYKFGANCPYCLEFEPTLYEVYQSKGMADAVEWHLQAAIRGEAPDYQCAHETAGCPYTTFALCAFEEANGDNQQKMEFLSCFGATNDPAAEKAQSCATTMKWDWATIATCAVGAKGWELKKQAAAAYVGAFPEQATGHFLVPRLFVEGKETTLEKDSVVHSICEAGAQVEACGRRLTMV